MLSGHFSLLSRSLFSALGELFSSFFEQDGGSVGYFLGCAEWAYFDSEGGGRLAAALRVRCCRLGRHLFVTLSGLLWRAYTSCERFHLRIGQSAKVFWPILTEAGGRKFLKSSLEDEEDEECFKRSCQGYLFLAQYISPSFFPSDSHLACSDEPPPRDTDAFRF